MPTKIDWCINPDGTQGVSWNPIKMRCTPVSEGCANCYARRILSRNLPMKHPYPAVGEPPIMYDDILCAPLSWKRPRMIFVESMGDLFHELVGWDDTFKVWEVMEKCPQHTFMILTKRVRFASMLPQRYFKNNANIWLGVTAENQEQADKRIPILLQIPAALRFVSVEPCLSPVNLDIPYGHGIGELLLDHLDWVQYGPETSANKRPFDIQWGLDLQRQCQDAGVPVFAKKLLHPEMIREMPSSHTSS